MLYMTNITRGEIIHAAAYWSSIPQIQQEERYHETKWSLPGSLFNSIYFN